MEPEVRKQIDEIWAILREGAERSRQADLRMDKADQRMDRIERRLEKHDERMAKADQRFEAARKIYDQRFEATRKLVRGGINFVTRKQLETDAKFAAVNASIDSLVKSQKAFIDSLKKGGNGNGRKHA